MFDTCGTGGDGAHTFNVSTVAALVLAACGVRVAKHGNRSASSRCGSADLFEALGVERRRGSPAIVERCLEEAGIAFLFAQVFHPSMKHAAQTRRELGVRTAFNLLGPLTNPAGASRQLVGVPRPELTELVARSLAQLGAERAWVVHGADGLDEISTTGYTKVSECRDGAVNTFYLHPTDVGLGKAAPAALKGGEPDQNAAIARAVLAGRPGPARDIVLLNAGASLLIAGKVATIPEGIDMARGGHRQRPGRGGPRSARENLTCRSARVMTTAAPDLLATIVAGTRRIVEVRRSRLTEAMLERQATGRKPNGGGFVRALRDDGVASRDRGVQAPIAVARDPPRGLPTGRAREGVCRRRCGGHLRPDGADVLRRVARAPAGRPRRPFELRSCARTSSSSGTRSWRRWRPARTRSC